MSTSKIIMLRPPSIKDEGNYIEFIEQAKDDYCEINGDVGLCLTTGVEFIPPNITVTDYNPEIVLQEGEQPQLHYQSDLLQSAGMRLLSGETKQWQKID